MRTRWGSEHVFAPDGTGSIAAVQSTVEHDFPLRIAATARAGIERALTEEHATITDRLYAYEIQEAGERLASAKGLSCAVRITAIADRVSFTLIRP